MFQVLSSHHHRKVLLDRTVLQEAEPGVDVGVGGEGRVG